MQGDRFQGNFAIAARRFSILNLENVMQSTRRILLGTALAVGVGLILSPSALYAQKDAGSKARGEHSVPFWSSRASSRRITTARDYARDFHGYIVANPKPDPAVVKEVTTEIGRNLDEAKKHLAVMKKDFADDKDAVAGIEGLEKQLAAAFDHHKLLCECCEKQTFDAITAMKCCDDLASQLDKIVAEHDALMRKIAGKAAVSAAPAAPAAKKK